MSDLSDSDSLEQKPGRKRTGLVVVAAIFGLGLIWILGYRMAGNSAVHDLEVRIKLSGQPLTLADLDAAYALPKGATNGAELLLDVWEQTSPDFWRAFREGNPRLPTRQYPQYDRALPFQGSDAQRLSRIDDLPATNRIAAEVYLDGMVDHLEAVRAALRCSHFHFPVQVTNGFAALLPHLSELKTEASNFRIEALLACERGDTDGALGSLEDAARVGKVLVNEPFLISQLVRIACSSMVLEDLQRLWSRHSLSAAQLDRVHALLEQLTVPGALRTLLISERVVSVSAFSLVAAKLLGPMGEDTASQVGPAAAMGVFSLVGLKAADHRLMLETMTEAIALAEKGDPTSIERIERLFWETGQKARRFPPRIFTAMILPGLERVPGRCTAFDARLAAAKTALAIERYRLAHEGRLPEKLEELVPQFLKAVPDDPFDGKPLRFERLPTGFVVYSIGNNRVDDGGKEQEKRSSRDHDETFFIER